MTLQEKWMDTLKNYTVWTVHAGKPLTKYQKEKALARDFAIQWQFENMQDGTCFSWLELAEISAFFEKLGKRYGLIKEFKENGII